MNLTYARPKMRANVEKLQQPSQHKICRLSIRKLSENITSDVMVKYQKWQHWYQ